MQRKKPEVYQQILDSDRRSREIFSGHGAALAQCYNHMIMPLASERDKETQVLWGIADFEHRFARRPEGMWLPETAVDLDTLEILAANGIKFTMLAPRQAGLVRRIGEEGWKDVSGEKIDPRRPYLCRLPSGATIAIFFYDGPIARDVAFRNLLGDGKQFSDRLISVFSPDNDPQLVHIATDGESYGHHHRFGDMALAYCLERVRRDSLAQLTVYGQYLERFPPEYEVRIYENSSWSCVHGVERWRADCGCNSGGKPGWRQQWRSPLRQALNDLRDQASSLYEQMGREFLKDPRAARNDYIQVILGRDEAARRSFFDRQASRTLSPGEQCRLLHLMEMQRNAMLMFTSCGWFFDDISGIETVQILQYAAKVLQLIRETSGRDLSAAFLEHLKTAPSNDARYGDGRVVFETRALPAVVDMKRVVAHYAMTSLFEDYSDEVRIYCFSLRPFEYETARKESERLAVGRVTVHSDLTCEERTFSFVVFYLGGHDLYAGISERLSEREFSDISRTLKQSFLGERSQAAMDLMQKSFEAGPFSLKHLFRDEQAKILYQMLDSSLVEVERSLKEIHDHHYPIMRAVRELNMPLPKVLANTVLVMVNTDFLHVVSQEEINFDRLASLVAEVAEWKLDVDETTLEFFVSRRMKTLMDAFYAQPQRQELLEIMTTLLKTLEPLKLRFDVGKVQNLFFSMSRTVYPSLMDRARGGDEGAQQWTELFRELAGRLNVAIGAQQGAKNG